MADEPQSFEELYDAALEELEPHKDRAGNVGDPVGGTQSAELAAFVEATKAWLQQRWGERKACPYCGNTEWWVGLPVDLQPDDEDWGVHAPVTCRYCGHRVFVDPFVPDLVEPVPEEPEDNLASSE